MFNNIKVAIMLNKAVLFIVFLFPIFSEANEWELVKEDECVQIFLRDVSGSDIREYKGVIKIKGSISSVMKVLDDSFAMDEWFYRSKEPILLKQKHLEERYSYQVSEYPFPASNRDIIVKTKLSRDIISGAIRIKMESVPNFCKRHSYKEVCENINESNLVHIQKLKGYFLLEPLNKNLTRLTWQMHTELEGSLPAWIVNQKLVDVPFESLVSLKELVKEKKYKDARMKIDNGGRLLGFIPARDKYLAKNQQSSTQSKGL